MKRFIPRQTVFRCGNSGYKQIRLIELSLGVVISLSRILKMAVASAVNTTTPFSLLGNALSERHCNLVI